MENKMLLTVKIIWKRHSSNERYFYHYEGEKLILLRVNNFPDEPLYTLINGLDILDMEDKPNDWILEL
jgi:hypothetical protein